MSRELSWLDIRWVYDLTDSSLFSSLRDKHLGFVGIISGNMLYTHYFRLNWVIALKSYLSRDLILIKGPKLELSRNTTRFQNTRISELFPFPNMHLLHAASITCEFGLTMAKKQVFEVRSPPSEIAQKGCLRSKVAHIW